jgi:hypothetical protein
MDSQADRRLEAQDALCEGVVWALTPGDRAHGSGGRAVYGRSAGPRCPAVVSGTSRPEGRHRNINLSAKETRP